MTGYIHNGLTHIQVLKTDLDRLYSLINPELGKGFSLIPAPHDQVTLVCDDTVQHSRYDVYEALNAFIKEDPFAPIHVIQISERTQVYSGRYNAADRVYAYIYDEPSRIDWGARPPSLCPKPAEKVVRALMDNTRWLNAEYRKQLLKTRQLLDVPITEEHFQSLTGRYKNVFFCHYLTDHGTL